MKEESRRMLEGLTSPCINFLGLHSCRYASPRAAPFAIFSRVDHVRLGDG